MKTRVFLCLSAILLTIGLHAQDLTILVNKKGKVGFADKSGAEVIKCEYESAQPFNEGISIVTKSGRMGFIDTTGKELLPPRFIEVKLWSEGIYYVKSEKKMGLVDRSGTFVLPEEYSHISMLNCHGRALIASGGTPTTEEKMTYMSGAKYGVIDSQGKILIEARHKGLYEFSVDCKDEKAMHEGIRLQFTHHYTADTLVTDCSYMGFSDDALSIENAGIMDGNGTELLQTGLYNIVMKPQEGMARYYNKSNGQTECGYFDMTAGSGFIAMTVEKTLDKIDSWTHGDFRGIMAPVNIDGKWAFVEKSGKTLRSGYTDVKNGPGHKLWAAKKEDGKWVTFTNSNKDVAALSGYSDINFPADVNDKEIYSVKKNGKYGCINASGKTVLPFIYDYAYGNTFDMVPVKKNGKMGIMSPENTCILPTEYISIMLPTERGTKHLWVKKSDAMYYHLNVATKKLSTKGYKTVRNFNNGIAYVVPPTMQVDNTLVNRAQMYKPNTPSEKIKDLDTSTASKYFGYLLSTDDEMLMDLPVSTLYKNAVLKELEKLKGRVPTMTEKKAIMLKVTRENRSYSMFYRIKEEEWDY
ncbi:MAG: WG repeat-containing protein [Prevotellaceae bacterium]|nr:WG repeat-containing protein [Prevotellaceae bacterium]